jgi:hypothetical protein
VFENTTTARWRSGLKAAKLLNPQVPPLCQTTGLLRGRERDLEIDLAAQVHVGQERARDGFGDRPDLEDRVRGRMRPACRPGLEGGVSTVVTAAVIARCPRLPARFTKSRT